MTFEKLQLIDPLLRAVTEQGYTEPTPIQQQAIPHVLNGDDLIGLAQTGTGKTAAFALPTLQRLDEINAERSKKKRFIQVLVLAPTRELASQISDSFKAYGQFLPYKYVTIFGGVSQRPQVQRLQRGVNIIVATPGRLLDLMDQGQVRVNRLEILILDEADRMLDMGFMPDIKRIIAKLPERRQTLLFSATMPPDIRNLAKDIQHNPKEVAVAPESTPVELIEQRVFFVEKSNKRKLLTHLLEENNMHRTLVFTRTKHGANRLSQQLSKAKFKSEAIHGNKSQRARETALANFKRGKTQVLVATDIAARGIDVDDISHVVNYDLPNETESYVHRIGRTGRAGSEGIALSFCAEDERPYLVDIERLIQMHIDVDKEHPFASALGVPSPTDLSRRRSGSKNNNRRKKKSKGGNNRRRDHQNSGNRGGSNNKRRRRNNNSKSGQRPTPQA